MASGTRLYDGPRTAAKGKVNFVATSNVSSLSAGQTVGGLAATDGDIGLLTAQTTGTENGLYYVRSGAWERVEYGNTADDFANGCRVFCTEGTYAGTYWDLVTAAVTPDTTDHTWIQAGDAMIFSGAADMVANTTTSFKLGPVRTPVTVIDITSGARTANASTSGTVVMTVAAGGNSLLNASTDLESDGTTRTSQTLTGTTANLDLSVGDVFTVSIVSDNADATGGLDTYCEITCIPTAP